MEVLRRTELDLGSYRPGFPVRVEILQRERRVSVSDAGAAIELAGRAPGWREVAWQLARELDVNVSRTGVVSLPVVAVGPGLEAVTADRGGIGDVLRPVARAGGLRPRGG